MALGDVKGEVVNLTTALDNGYVDYISYAKGSDGGLTVMAKVTNAGPDTIISDINLYIDGKMIGVKEQVEIPSGGSKIAYFDGLYVQGSVLMAELNRKDDLMEDNCSYEVIKTGEEEAKVLLVTEQNVYLEKAMAQIPNVKVTKTNEIRKINEFENENYDLYIFDGMVPDGDLITLPKQGNILIFDGYYEPYFTGKRFTEGLRVSAEQNSVMKYIENANFGVGRGYIYEVPDFADSFLTTSEGSIGFIGLHDTQTIAAMGFDVHDSDLPLLVEFPILIHNLLNETIITGMVSSTKLDCGDSVRISSKLDGEDVVVRYPDATESLLLTGSAIFDSTYQVGVYHVSQKFTGGELSADFAVNFPNEESENVISDATAVDGDEDKQESNTVSAPLNLRNWILLFVLIALVIEWIVYVKRS